MLPVRHMRKLGSSWALRPSACRAPTFGCLRRASVTGMSGLPSLEAICCFQVFNKTKSVFWEPPINACNVL